jgi:metal-responsive CopG/Arc/MetJ family transcriptional regulator
MMYCHTRRYAVPRAKVAITLEEATLRQLDLLVEQEVFPNRSQAIQSAVDEKLERLARIRLAQECAKLDPVVEMALAEEGLSEDVEKWPEY